MIRSEWQPPPDGTNERRQEPVEQYSEEVEHRQPEQGGDPLEQADASQPRAGQEPGQRSVAPPKRDLRMQARNGLQSSPGEQPHTLAAACHTLDDDVHLALVGGDGPHQFLIGSQRVRA